MTRDSELESVARFFFEISKEILKEDAYLSPLVIVREATVLAHDIWHIVEIDLCGS